MYILDLDQYVYHAIQYFFYFLAAPIRLAYK